MVLATHACTVQATVRRCRRANVLGTTVGVTHPEVDQQGEWLDTVLEVSASTPADDMQRKLHIHLSACAVCCISKHWLACWQVGPEIVR